MTSVSTLPAKVANEVLLNTSYVKKIRLLKVL